MKDAQREARDKLLADIERSPSNAVAIIDNATFRAAFARLHPGDQCAALDALKRKAKP